MDNTRFAEADLTGAIVTNKTLVVNTELGDLSAETDRSPWVSDDLSQYTLDIEEE